MQQLMSKMHHKNDNLKNMMIGYPIYQSHKLLRMNSNVAKHILSWKKNYASSPCYLQLFYLRPAKKTTYITKTVLRIATKSWSVSKKHPEILTAIWWRKVRCLVQHRKRPLLWAMERLRSAILHIPQLQEWLTFRQQNWSGRKTGPK